MALRMASMTFSSLVRCDWSSLNLPDSPLPRSVTAVCSALPSSAYCCAADASHTFTSNSEVIEPPLIIKPSGCSVASPSRTASCATWPMASWRANLQGVHWPSLMPVASGCARIRDSLPRNFWPGLLGIEKGMHGVLATLMRPSLRSYHVSVVASVSTTLAATPHMPRILSAHPSGSMSSVSSSFAVTASGGHSFTKLATVSSNCWRCRNRSAYMPPSVPRKERTLVSGSLYDSR
mmetsp:Transcript_28068/g.90652  ORF Transcript_28068/g.90652 Transcript_28068/m.90652 type:complete len:235 (-) Transcript_28068:666-1370(-)